MYKINKTSILKQITLRGNYLTKKILKKNTKQTLIFLRAPKHFNIGKHKVSSFVNFYKYLYTFNYQIPTIYLTKNNLFFLKFFKIFDKLHLLYIINSIKVKVQYKIK